MKKFMLLTTVVGLALTSCVNDTEVAPSPNRPLVSFDSPVMRSTRAKYQGEHIKSEPPPPDSKA